MSKNTLTFNDLGDDLTLKVFEHLTLEERILCGRVSRRWSQVLSLLPIRQQTLVIGQSDFDSEIHMRLSLCNVHPHHAATDFDMINNESLSGLSERAFIKFLTSFKNLKTIFINAPVRIHLSDLPVTIEHIHFGHNIDNVITFDNINFPHLTCISTSYMVDQMYENAITELIEPHKSRIENVSVWEIWHSLIDQMAHMRNLKQLLVVDSRVLFGEIYNHGLTLMVVHPALQYFGVCLYNWHVCPYKWVVEVGSPSAPFTGNIVKDVYQSNSFAKVVELSQDTITALHFNYQDNNDDEVYLKNIIQLNALTNVRISFGKLSNESIISGLQHFLRIGPNIQDIHLRFLCKQLFKDPELINALLNEVYSLAQMHPDRKVQLDLQFDLQFELGETEENYFDFIDFSAPDNLLVTFLTKRSY